jgi:hypothetical protein
MWMDPGQRSSLRSFQQVGDVTKEDRCRVAMFLSWRCSCPGDVPVNDGVSHPVLRVPRWELRALIPRGAFEVKPNGIPDGG